MRMSVGVLAALGVSFSVMASSIAWGAEGEPVGYVKNVDGEAFITSAGSEQKAVAGSPVHVGSVLRTGRASSMGVTFKDNTIMSFGPDTELTIDEYLYAPAQGKLKMGSRLTRGSMNYLSGVISRLRPEAVSIATPAGTIGTRGTQFVVRVEE